MPRNLYISDLCRYKQFDNRYGFSISIGNTTGYSGRLLTSLLKLIRNSIYRHRKIHIDYWSKFSYRFISTRSMIYATLVSKWFRSYKTCVRSTCRGRRNRCPIVQNAILALLDKWLSLDTCPIDEQIIIAQISFIHLGHVDNWFRTSVDTMLLVWRTSACHISRQPLTWHDFTPTGNMGNDMKNILFIWFSHFTVTETLWW